MTTAEVGVDELSLETKGTTEPPLEVPRNIPVRFVIGTESDIT